MRPKYGGGYAFEIKEDGIYQVQNGIKVLELDDYTLTKRITRMNVKEEGEETNEYEGKTEEADRDRIEIESGANEYRLERQEDCSIWI